MGLDTSHGCWSGAYSAFHRWRNKLAEVAGLPPLDFMEGFYKPLDNEHMPATLYHGLDTKNPAFFGGSGDRYMDKFDRLLPIKWDCLKPDPLYILLSHSDCEGDIDHSDCLPISESLEKLFELLPDDDAGGHIGNWREKTKSFIDGLKLAHESGENVRFH